MFKGELDSTIDLRGIAPDDRKISSKLDRVLQYVKNRNVLDVGCVGQAAGFATDGWLHEKVKMAANSILGVDVDAEGLRQMSERGYNVQHCDDLKCGPRKYDVILMLDVIEHVDNPTAFLAEYAEYLCDEGVMLVTTPNSHRSIDVLNIVINGSYAVNGQHSAWFCPKVLQEVVRRSGALKLHKFYWLSHGTHLPVNARLTVKVKFLLDRICWGFRNEFAPNFMFVLQKTGV